MCVDDHTYRCLKRHTEHHVRSLPSDSGEFDECLQICRHDTLVVSHQSLCQADQVLGLLPEHAQAVDALFDLFLAGAAESLRGRELGKESRRDLVDLNVRALSTESGRNDELEWAIVNEFTMRVRVRRD